MKPSPYSERPDLLMLRLACSRHRNTPSCIRGVRRGSALITALVFALIVAITLAGIGTLTVSHLALAHTQADSAAALNLAEAGINYELNYLTTHGGQAEAPGTINEASLSIAPSLSGTFSVSCKNTDGTDWTGPTLIMKTVLITSTATVNGVRRVVRIHGTPTGTFYTMYSTAAGKGAYTQFLGNNSIVNGISGTGGQMYIDPTLTSKPQLTGLVFNGPDAKWANGQPVSGYNPTTNSKPVAWETVTSLMNKRFPGGADYLSQPANNDNSMAVLTDPASPGNPQPGIVQNKLNPSGSQIVTLVGKPGGANYYLSNIYMTDQSNLILDNSKGPINIYYVNYNAKSLYLRGGHATQSFTENSAHRITMYLAATGDMDIKPNDNNEEVDMGIYAYDTKIVNKNIADFGGVSLNDNVNFKGQIIAKEITVKSNVTVTGQRGYFETPEEFFGFSGAWEELNSAGDVGGANQ